MTICQHLTVLIALLATAASAAAQSLVSADLVWSETPRPGTTAKLGILLDIEEGWHLQAGKGSGDDAPPYLPTEVDLTLPEGWTAGEIMWPPANTFQLGAGSFAETLRGYEGSVLIVIPVEVPADLAAGRHDLRAKIEYQACDDAVCVMPTDVGAMTTLIVDENGVRAVPTRRGVDKLFAAVEARYAADVPPLTIETAWYEGNLLPGRDATLGIVLDVAPGWRIGAGGAGGDLAATTIDVTLPAGWTAGEMMWPPAPSSADGGYQGRSMVVLPVVVPADAAATTFQLGLAVRYQASDGKTREDPTEIEVAALAVVDPDRPGHAEALPGEIAALFGETLRFGSVAPVAKSGWANPSKLRWWIALAFVIAAMVWMTLRTIAITPRPVPRVVVCVTAALSIALSYSFVRGVTGKSMFIPYTAVAFDEAIASGEKTVLIKFTADWCANCQVNEKLIVGDPEARTELTRPDVVAFKVDFTGENEEGMARKESLGGGGIPLIAVYSPGKEPVTIRGQLVSAQPVIDALRGEITETADASLQTFDFFNLRFSVKRDARMLIFGLALLAGFFMNFTPCVLPVIPLKILSLQGHAKDPARCLLLGTIFGLGIVTLYAAIGVLMAGFVKSIGTMDWGEHFSKWWVTVAIGLIVGAMGVGMLGFFMIQLPRFLYMFDPQSDTLRGSFFMGVFTAILSTPCTGPLLGATIAWTALQPPAVAFLTLLIMGVGMAFPYVLLTARPKWLDRLPRTGPGSELVKQVMGLLLIAVAVWFLGSGVAALAA